LTSEYEDVIRKCPMNPDFKNEINNNKFILNNNIGNKNTTIKNTNYNFNFSKFEQNMLRKRNRLSSFEGFWNNIDLENIGNGHKKSIDEIEILNSFGKEIKYDFNEEDIELFDECLKNNGFTIGIETRSKEQIRRRSIRHKTSVKK
jgi:hypothetical protein